MDGISNLLVSQSEIRVMGPPFYTQIIVIDTKFVLYSVSQEVCSQNRGILGQKSVYYQFVHPHTILRSTICSGLNFAKFQQCGKCWLI